MEVDNEGGVQFYHLLAHVIQYLCHVGLACRPPVSSNGLRSFHQRGLGLWRLLPENGCGRNLGRGRISSAREGDPRGIRPNRVRPIFVQWRRGAAVCQRLNVFTRTGKILIPRQTCPGWRQNSLLWLGVLPGRASSSR